MSTTRNVHDAKTKTEVSQQVLSKALTFEKACKQYDLQPYQLYAWLGQYSLNVALKPPQPVGPTLAASPPADNSTGQTGAHAMLGHALHSGGAPIDPDLARVIGEWILRNRT